MVLRINAGDLAPTLVEQAEVGVRELPRRERGDARDADDARAPRRLRFGRDYRVSPSPGLRAELDELLGSQAIAA